jgi:hypothetical protein
MRKVFTVIVLAGILASCNTSQTNSTSENNSNQNQKTMNNKEIVGALS